MKIRLTRPNIPLVDTERHLLNHWQRVSADSHYEITICTAHNGEHHEQLLSRLWLRALGRGGKWLFSDVDFIPFEGALQRVERDLDDYKAVFVPYFTREDSTNSLKKHPFWTGLWFWAIRLDHDDLLPPPHWIRTIGRPMDVGGGGLFHLLQSGFCGPKDVLFYDGEEVPVKRWINYPLLGYHLFYHRQFHTPDFQLGPNYFMRDHLREIDECLNHLGTPA